MPVNDLTEKGVEVQVNGSTQQTFDQRVNDAIYDVSVSGGTNVALDTGFNPSLTYNNIAFGIVSLASDADSGGSPGFHRYEASFSDGSSFSTETDSGNAVVFTRAGAYPTGANVENQGGSDSVVNSGTQAHTITYQGGISINGVTQS